MNMVRVIRFRAMPQLVLVFSLSVLVVIDCFAVVVLSSVVNPAFGDLLGGASGRNFILGTNGVVSGSNAADYVSGAYAGSLLITGNASQSISVQATNLTANGGVSIANVTCNYNGGGDTDCVAGFTGVPPDVTGKTLLIGVEINTTTIHGDNATASPGFDVVVNYI